MKVKRLWIEIEDEHGDHYMVPTTITALSAEMAKAGATQVEGEESLVSAQKKL